MAISHEDRKGHFLPAFLVAILVASVILPTVSAVDTDGDGTDDASDDCPYAAGTSTIDKVGCPDRDGDGTSDWADSWTSTNPNFQKEFSIPQNYDFNDADYSPDGEWVATADENGYLRVWNASTGVNDRSVVAYSGGDVGSVSWSVMEDTSE